MQAIRFGYEKAGLRVRNEPIPWNADAVLVEAWIWSAPDNARRKGDFQLRVPGCATVTPVLLQPQTEPDVLCVTFRLPPLHSEGVARLYCQGNMLGQVLLPFLSPEMFFRELRLQSATIWASLGPYNVACQTFVEGQCHGLSACGVLTSATSLLPIVDHDLTAKFTDHATGYTQTVSVPLTGAQLLGKRAFLSVIPPQAPPMRGVCSVQWNLKDRPLAQAVIRGISEAEFQQSLYLVESRCVDEGIREGTNVNPLVLPRDGVSRLRPCFQLASREPGMAAVCPLEVRVQFRSPARAPMHLQQEILVTDGPSVWLPGPINVDDFQHIQAFELLSQGRSLGVLWIRPAPMASFTNEGGFKSLEDYDWTPFTENELLDRLQKLMGPGHEDEVLQTPTPVR